MSVAGVLVDVDGRTFAAWALDLFEYDDCEECGRGAAGHDGELVNGHWFARCRHVGPYSPAELARVHELVSDAAAAADLVDADELERFAGGLRS